MFLQKLEIQGFKSFANKNVLTFPEKGGENKKGMTAVVGPNGSGKSNIADAIRWSLGEQSMKTLRAKTGEDVIFSGSTSKGQLGMAEVSLYLNNEDRQVPIDYSEIVITRRLFRDGESEYLLNNAKTRLSDIQMLLAKANFGQKTYSVIGQGMVEGFLATTASERKDFFDEATGVRQFQIKRDMSLNKLIASYENLGQANMLLAEIDPRLKSLTRQVSRLRKKGEIEEELKKLRTIFFKHGWHKLNDKLLEFNEKILVTEGELNKKTKELEKINEDLNNMEGEAGKNPEIESLLIKISELQKQREEVLTKIAGIDAQLSMELESRGNFDLSWLFNRENDLKKKINEDKKTINDLKKEVSEKKSGLPDFKEEKGFLNSQIDSLNKKLLDISRLNEKEEVDDKKIVEKLKKIREYLEDMEREDDVLKIKDIVLKIKAVITEIIDLNDKNENVSQKAIVSEQMEIQEQLIRFASEKENLIIKENKSELETRSLEEKINIFEKNLKKDEEELDGVKEKISKNQDNKAAQERQSLSDKKEKLEVDLKNIENTGLTIKNKIDELDKKESEKRISLFKIQRAGQILQQEINALANELNGLKIEAVKYETKLEDLETEIRQTMDNIKEIREEKLAQEINSAEIEIEIKKLENQYSLIGGIDPGVEKEYEEIKQRYDFLYSQVSDLEAAIKSLDCIIRELDEKIKEKFEKEFKVICKKFEEYFKILFSGGSAKIVRLSIDDVCAEEEKATEEEKVVDEKEELKEKIKKLTKFNATGLAGIEIQACPPGKVIKSLSVLSGGEKALTAIALICAIISANPSPFVVLDEVEAALDESNSERLAKILDDLSHKTQFILITHNRASMRHANVLYGVTMEDSGISKVLSVKLEEYIKKI